MTGRLCTIHLKSPDNPKGNLFKIALEEGWTLEEAVSNIYIKRRDSIKWLSKYGDDFLQYVDTVYVDGCQLWEDDIRLYTLRAHDDGPINIFTSVICNRTNSCGWFLRLLCPVVGDHRATTASKENGEVTTRAKGNFLLRPSMRFLPFLIFIGLRVEWHAHWTLDTRFLFN